jgi:hypothetical protein
LVTSSTSDVDHTVDNEANDSDAIDDDVNDSDINESDYNNNFIEEFESIGNKDLEEKINLVVEDPKSLIDLIKVKRFPFPFCHVNCSISVTR